jgi:hypothetical protein
MSKIYLYFYKNGNGSNFFFHDSKDVLDSLSCFDALISEVDLITWKSDKKNYPNPKFPLPGYIIEGFKVLMYELLKESADHSYDDLNKKYLKASVALFMLNDYQNHNIEEYDSYFKELKEIQYNFDCLNKLLKTINNIDDFYNFKHAILPSGQLERKLNKVCVAKKQLNIDVSPDFSAELSTNSGFMSDSNEV